MKKRWIVVLVAMVMATTAFAAKPKYPSYLIMDGTTVAGVKNQKKLPAELVIPEGVTAIGNGAFQGCASLASVTIPESVTAIGNSAFYGCTSLASVTVPESVTEIGRSVFSGCISLKNVIIPEGATTIGKETFYNCVSLASVIIPSSVTTIGENAFERCTSLVSVTIPDGTTTIGGYAFYGCTSLKEVQFKGTMAQWKAIQGSNYVNISGIRCSDGYIGVKEVPDYLKMEGTKVIGSINLVPKNLVIPEGVTAIGGGAFRDCTSLVSVTIPASVMAIGNDVFKGCTSLKEIQFKGTVAQWDAIQRDGAITIAVRCSDGNVAAEVVPNLKMDGTVVTGYTGTLPAKLVIPRGVTEIRWGAFRGCDSLESVTIPSSVKEIDSRAFEDCTSLESVTIPGSVTSIGSTAFSGCTSLKEIQFKGTKAQWEAIKGSDEVKVSYISFTDGYIGVKDVPAYLNMSGTRVTGYNGKVPANLVIPNGVTEIGRHAFNGCLDIVSVTIPESVKGIEDGLRYQFGWNTIVESAFFGCTYLERVTILGELSEISDCLFYNCSSLKSINLPDSVTSIGLCAFWNCASLVSVTIPDSVTRIQNAAFYGCSSLASVNIPKGVEVIGNMTFSGCKSLARVIIPEGVKKIGERAFESCTSLKSVTIPRGVTEIDSLAFDDCTSLANVVVPRSVTRIGLGAFSDCSPHLKIQYDGTKAQWNAISGSKPNAAVQCTDGEVVVK